MKKNSNILIIGNSHAGALIAASNVLKKSGVIVDWICQPSALPLIHESGLVEGNNSAEINVVKSKENIFLNDYGSVLFSAFGSGNPRERKWNHPYFELQLQPLSTSLLQKIILSHLKNQILFIDKLVSVYKGNIFCQPQPRPLKKAIDGINIENNYKLWKRYCRAEIDLVSNKLESCKVNLLKYPNECEFFTKESYISSDPFHVNQYYGEIILDNILINRLDT